MKNTSVLTKRITSYFNIYGTNQRYPPRNEMVVYWQDIYCGVSDTYRLKLTVFLVPKKIDSWCFPVRKISISGVLPAKFPSNFFGKIFIAPKDSFLNFRGSLFSYFPAFVLIAGVISILEDFGSIMPAVL